MKVKAGDSAVRVMVRDYVPELDNPYIYSTWSKYSWYSPKEPINIPKRQWFNEQILRIKNSLEFGDTKIACLESAPTVIMGYIVVMNGKVQWICIKKPFHNEGIETLLIKSIRGLLIEDGRQENDNKRSPGLNEDQGKRHSGVES